MYTKLYDIASHISLQLINLNYIEISKLIHKSVFFLNSFQLFDQQFFNVFYNNEKKINAAKFCNQWFGTIIYKVYCSNKKHKQRYSITIARFVNLIILVWKTLLEIHPRYIPFINFQFFTSFDNNLQFIMEKETDNNLPWTKVVHKVVPKVNKVRALITLI